MKRTSHSFYILMIDYGRSMEAVSNPEHTKRHIISEVRDILAKPNGRAVAFVKFVDGNYIFDCTDEIVGEASFDNAMGAIADALATPQANALDHARKLRVEA